jgi:hypothetical protein
MSKHHPAGSTILVALAVLWATGSLGPVYRWLVVLRSHSISRAIRSRQRATPGGAQNLLVACLWTTYCSGAQWISANQNCRQVDTGHPLPCPACWRTMK